MYGGMPSLSPLSSLELLEWGRTFSDFWGKIVLYIYGQQTYKNVCTLGEK